jgi:glycerol-3-phosphate cytidylyltransferase-like family protein
MALSIFMGSAAVRKYIWRTYVKEIVDALKCVDEVFYENSLELRGEYIRHYGADDLVMGGNWSGRFDQFSAHCEVIYLTRTPAISTTAVIEKIRH